MVTDRPGLLLGILTADCAPVLLADAEAGVVGAAHAGWRGALAGVTDATIAAMVALGARRERIAAAVGPCIAQAILRSRRGFRRRASSPTIRTMSASSPTGPRASRISTSKPMSSHRLPPPASARSRRSASTPMPTRGPLLQLPPRDPSRRGRLTAAKLSLDRARPIDWTVASRRLARGQGERRAQRRRNQRPTSRRPPSTSTTQIGNHKLEPVDADDGLWLRPGAVSEGSLKPPIFLTSTFVFENAAAGKRFFEGITGKRPGGAEGLVYSRFNGPNQEILEDRLAIWEDAEDALAFSSGMSAIATLLLTFVRPGDVRRPFGPALCGDRDARSPRSSASSACHYVDFPAGATREEIDAVIARAKAKGRVALIYLESPANPTNALVDVEAVARRPRRRVRRRRAPADRDRQHLPRAAVGQAARAGRRLSRLQPDQICRRPQRPRRRRRWSASRALHRPGPDDAQHDGHDLRPQHRLDAAAQPRNARAAHDPRRRECGEGLRLPARPSQGREGRLSRLPRGRIAPGRHLQPPLHRRRARPSRSI